MPHASTQTNKSYAKYIKKTFGGRYKKRKKKSKRVYKVSAAKLADKKINTLLEKRMVEIAQAATPTLIFRRYCLGTMDPDNNSYFSAGVRIGMDAPIAINISRIPAQDINFVVNAPAVDDPNTQVNENADPDGAQQGMNTIGSHGRRTTNLIKVTGISLEIVAYNDMGIMEDGLSDDNVRSAVLSNRGRCSVYYKVIRVTSDEDVESSPFEEAVKQCLNYASGQIFGYTPLLDTQQDPNADHPELRIKTIMKGTINLDTTVGYNTSPADVFELKFKEKRIKRYIKFDKPQTIEYAPQDQNGTNPRKYSYWVVISSNIKGEANGSHNYEPIVNCCSKLFYKNA